MFLGQNFLSSWEPFLDIVKLNNIINRNGSTEKNKQNGIVNVAACTEILRNYINIL